MPYFSARKKPVEKKPAPLINHAQAIRSRAVRSATMKAGGFAGQYAWFYMTKEEQQQYAQWKASPSSGVFSIDTGLHTVPKNWLLLEEGSTGDVAKRDVGLIGIKYLQAAVSHMRAGGTDAVIERWQKEVIE